MEGSVREEHIENENENDAIPKTTENFQKFIYDLFEKNGVINDLRAYLRGHIVNVLKNVETGNVPSCQKHFTQRLDLQFQAVNILIAEYLLNLEFSYTVSVFLSEIPLANMVFDLAQNLLKIAPDGDYTGLRFKDKDIWSILNYLGIKCDSENALQIMQLYKTEEQPSLLFCIFKGASMYHKSTVNFDNAVHSEDSVSSVNSSEDKEVKDSGIGHKRQSLHDKCRHYMVCKTCQSRVSKLREKYKKNKKILLKKIESDVNPNNVECLLKNINLVEGTLMNEMFEQLRSVYETEVEMIRGEEKKTIERTLTRHEMELDKRRLELEASLKAREEKIELNAQKKKEFLWGVALGLRRQQRRLEQEMRVVREQARKLAEKEENLKISISEAEKSLKQRGEKIRVEISKELIVLEQQSEAMKRERDSVSKERLEIEKLRHSKNIAYREEFRKYELLKNEINELKMCVDGRVKCVVDKSVMTEISDAGCRVLNNVQNKSSMKTIVNDLKHKIVNFDQAKITESCPSRPEVQSASDRSRYYKETIQKLREDNERLRDFAKLQTAHVAALRAPRGRSGQMSLTSGVRASTRTPSPRQKERKRPVSAGPVLDHEPAPPGHVHERVTFEMMPSFRGDSRRTYSDKTREKSPKTVLKEAKDKLRTVRKQSARSTVQEATRRARALQLEADAAEDTYNYFRRSHASSDAVAVDRLEVIMNLGAKYRSLDTGNAYVPSLPMSPRLDGAALKEDFDKYISNYANYNIGYVQVNNRSLVTKITKPNPISFTEEKENCNLKENLLEKPLTEFRKLYYSQKYSKPKNIINKYNRNRSNEYKNEILDSNSSESYKSIVSSKELHKSDQNITKLSDIQDKELEDDKIDNIGTEQRPDGIVAEKNLLRIEIEKSNTNSESDNVNDIEVIIESSLDELINEVKNSENVTVILSRSSPVSERDKSVSEKDKLKVESLPKPETEELSVVETESAKNVFDDDIAHEYGDDDIAHEHGDDEIAQEYRDDFSADVDNYNSRSEYGNRSPISLPKSEDGFWDE